VNHARRRSRLCAPGLALFACAVAWAPAALAREPIVTRFDIPDNRIAITFDACATKTQGYGFDRQVYRILQRERVPATIFVSGRWVDFHPGVMTELAADPLIEFGNHSYDHPHMSRLANHDMELEVDETEAALGRYGKRGVAFRPPFGDFNARMLDVVRDRGLPVVSWDVVSGDPAAATTTEGMIREVERHTRSGSIVIFHINGRGHKTAEALPRILRELRERGFSFVHLSELLGGGAPAPSLPATPAVVAPPAAIAPTYVAPPAVVAPVATTPAVVAPPPFVPAPPVHRRSTARVPAPARAADAGAQPTVLESAGHAPTAAEMRLAAEGAKHAPGARP